MNARGLRRSQAGSVLILSSIILSVISISVTSYVAWFQQSRRSTVSEDHQLQVRLLAQDLLEFAKYLVLYERAFFIDSPKSQTPALKDLWTYGINEEALKRACGGYGLGMNYMGVHHVGAKKVFCPYVLRYATLKSAELEQLFLNQYQLASGTPAGRQKILDNPEPGVYRLTLDLSGNDLLFKPAENDFIDFFEGYYDKSGKHWWVNVKDTRYLNRLEAKIFIYIRTDAAGYVPARTERYITLASEVRLKDSRAYHREEEDLMVMIPTPRDFALFIPWGHDGMNDSRRFEPAAPTSTLNTAIRFHQNANIYGRTYFNGDLWVNPTSASNSLANLPTFHEPLVLSGQMRGVSDPHLIPQIEQLPELQRRFKKGLVQGFSAERYLLSNTLLSDGNCGATGLRILNGSLLNCRTNGTSVNTPANYIQSAFGRYMQNVNSGAWWRVVKNTPPQQTQPSTDPKCYEFFSGSATGMLQAQGPKTGAGGGCYSHSPEGPTLYAGGFRRLEIAHTGVFEMIHSPVFDLSLPQGLQALYGVIFGGRILAGQSNNLSIYSTSALKVGLPGIANAVDLGKFNLKALESSGGLSIPLYNFPVVYSSKEAVR